MKNIANHEYDACINMRVAESQIQWERYNAMLVINTIFIGFIGFTYSKDFNVPLIIMTAFPIFGMILCFLWLNMTERGFMWTKFWTELARQIEEKYGNTQINPFMVGLKKKEKSKIIPNTARGAIIIIAMFMLIYFLSLVIIIYPYINMTQFLALFNTFNIFVVIGTIEGVLLYRFKAAIFDYNSELGFNTIAIKEEKGKLKEYLKDKRESQKSAPVATKIWHFLSMIIGTTLGWILLWFLLEKRIKYFSNVNLQWEDFALFLLAYIGISGRLPIIAESVQQWFKR